ncbi:MAG: PfkB family carbohydrate kinase [Candidatus ainarchaeum sp.]|nr:PfkB family carbohydrate kinase [Candidatus ainarchaeum sp.]
MAKNNSPEVVLVGSIGLDSIETPFGKVENALGGSASYASLAAGFFARPGIVSIIGWDFPEKHIAFFKSKGIDTSGIEKSEKATFHWEGKYGFDINAAETLKTELNSLLDFSPKLPEEYRSADFLFLGNIDPELQLNVLSQMKKKPKLVIADTMNYWIKSKRGKVLEVVKAADICLMNDAEARQLFSTPNLVLAAKKILELDSKFAIIKKGEHGCLLFSKNSHFSAPGYPLENITDPTGCGDSFGGALIGYLAKTKDFSEKNFRKAIITASAIASFNAEDFSLNRMGRLKKTEITNRIKEFKKITKF